MRILILTDGIYPFVIGGMQKHSFYLAKFLSKRGHDVMIVHCVPAGKSLPGEEETRNAMELEAHEKLQSRSLSFPAPGIIPGHYLKESYIYSEKVYRAVEADLQSYDFIYIKGFAGWHLLSKKAKGVTMPPVGIKFHGYEMYQPPASFKSRFEHWLLRGPVKWNSLKADFVFSYGGKISPIIKSLGVTANKIIEIPTGIESSWCSDGIAGKKNNTVQFVFVGRFERRKGIEELNEALRTLLTKSGFHFHFIGPVPATRKIKSEYITYHGQLTTKAEIQNVLDGCNVLVVPSHSEGMPNVIMEGMARGLAILATDVGAVSVVVNEDNGWLISPANHQQLQTTLSEIVSMKLDQLQQKQKKSLDKIKEFFWERIAEQTESQIRRVIGK